MLSLIYAHDKNLRKQCFFLHVKNQVRTTCFIFMPPKSMSKRTVKPPGMRTSKLLSMVNELKIVSIIISSYSTEFACHARIYHLEAN